MLCKTLIFLPTPQEGRGGTNKYGSERVHFVCSLKQQQPASHSGLAGAHPRMLCPHIYWTANTKETSIFFILFHSCCDEVFRVCLCHLPLLLGLSPPASAGTAQSSLYQGDTGQAFNTRAVNPLNAQIHTLHSLHYVFSLETLCQSYGLLCAFRKGGTAFFFFFWLPKCTHAHTNKHNSNSWLGEHS